MPVRRIAFYAPLKAPNHPIPSGDRRMGQLLIQALEAMGAVVHVASDFRAYDGQGDPAHQATLRDIGLSLADDLITHYQAMPRSAQPTAWFTYHLYHKAPDWLGPRITAALGIPYLVAEASFAPKQAGGPWDMGHQAAGRAIAAADLVFCMTRLDMACVQPLIPADHDLVFLPPFLDVVPFLGVEQNRKKVAQFYGVDPSKYWLLAVGMMRPGDKLQSYQRLGAALRHLDRDDMQLLVLGDGAARNQVVEALAPVRDRTKLYGAVSISKLREVYCCCDLYTWPGVGEAYGMAYLEAQASGLPVVAGNEGGIPDVVLDGDTGLLTPPGDDVAFAMAIGRLLDDVDLRNKLSRGAQDFVSRERTVQMAANLLGKAIP